MPSDRSPRLRRRRSHQPEGAPSAAEQPAVVAEEPAVVADVMEAATQRLRDQAWKINATTRPPLISEEAARPAPVATPDDVRIDG